MQQELVSLERRITSLEDAELEVMERLEEAQQVLDGLGIRAADIDARLAELGAARDEKRAEIDPRSTRLGRQRGPAAEGMPEDLMALYDGCASRRASAPRCCAPASAAAATWPSTPPSCRGSGPPRPTRSSGARSASGSWCAPRVRSLSERDASRGRHRGGRRARAATPARCGVRRGAPGRGQRRGARRGGTAIGVASNDVAEYSRPDRRPPAAEVFAPEPTSRPDGLQARVEQMSRWKVKHPTAAAGVEAPAGAVRHDVHLGPARRRTRTPTGSRTRRSTASRPPGSSIAPLLDAGQIELVIQAAVQGDRGRRAGARAGAPADHAGPGRGTASPPLTAGKRVLRRPGCASRATSDDGRAQDRPSCWLAADRLGDGRRRRGAARARARSSPPSIIAELLGGVVGGEPRFAEMSSAAGPADHGEVAEHQRQLAELVGAARRAPAQHPRVVPPGRGGVLRAACAGCSTRIPMRDRRLVGHVDPIRAGRRPDGRGAVIDDLIALGRATAQVERRQRTTCRPR